MSTIEQITSIEDYRGERPEGWGVEAGFQIHTNQQTITLAIADESSCCESWGYFLTEDNLDKFVGAELLGVKITDTNRSTKHFTTGWSEEGDNNIALDEGDTLFVDIETDRGNLQFVAYNAQNGYYGHAARVSSEQLTLEKVL